MGRSFYMSGAWEIHERRLRASENRYEDFEGTEMETRTAGGRTRKAYKSSVLGLDSTEVHYMGDPVNIRREEPIGNGDDVAVYFDRWSDDGKTFRGTYKTDARKDGQGRLIFGGQARRVYGV